MRNLTATTTALLTIAAALLSACSSESSPTAVTDPGPEPDAKSTLQLDFSYIEVIKDCDGIEGKGDFSFTVNTSVSSGGSRRVYGGSPTLGDGERTSAIGRYTYSVPATDGQQVTVEFIATEHDKNIFGKTHNDDRMSSLRRTAAHRYNNGQWSGTGPQSITLGSGDCQVRLRYTADNG